MSRTQTLACADCGRPMWDGRSSLPQGQARCRECRRLANLHRETCPDCGGRKSPQANRCKPCANKAHTVRAEGDRRLVRKHREQAAPGLTATERARLMARWARQRKACIYCGELATTVDHVVPLVRGGTNYEGNLAPCCKSCNSSKAGCMVVEWRTGKRLPRMAHALGWKLKAKPIKAIKGVQLAFNVCPACGMAHVRESEYCSPRCQSRSAYRLKVGKPIAAPLDNRGRRAA